MLRKDEIGSVAKGAEQNTRNEMGLEILILFAEGMPNSNGMALASLPTSCDLPTNRAITQVSTLFRLAGQGDANGCQQSLEAYRLTRALALIVAQHLERNGPADNESYSPAKSRPVGERPRSCYYVLKDRIALARTT